MKRTESIQFDGTNCIAVLHFMGSPDWGNPELHSTDHPCVHGPRGPARVAEVGDWIERGLDGHCYLTDEPSLAVVCDCGNHYSLHTHTVCLQCHAWPK